jgi:trk system potassium uptake protein TrkH
MAFLPVLKVGGMQLFRSESFDTFGKILPRAAEIAGSISAIYLALTGICTLAYAAGGMSAFDALVHAMTTIATGGFANYDNSFAAFSPSIEYMAAFFMVVASLPFVRLVQFAAGTAKPLANDPQIRAFLAISFSVVGALTLYLAVREGSFEEEMLRKALFNSVSILTGTGYASSDYGAWGPFAVATFFMIGLVGGCAGSTSCAIKVFRFQVLIAAAISQIKRIQTPRGVFVPRYGRRPIGEDVISSVMSFFFLFALTFSCGAIALSMMGLDLITSLSSAATALANVGPGLGSEVGPTGNFAGLPDAAKWLLSALMLLGRLELLSVFILITPAFWRV